ncbi:MAG: Peptide deformylase 1 [Holosporales bacterium]
MTVLHVLTEPDPQLRKISQPVEAVTPQIQKFLDDMIETMIAEEGCGLAAPQVNVLKRMIVIQYRAETSVEEDDENEIDIPYITYKMVNPTIIEKSPLKHADKEGCLSVPGEQVCVERHESIVVRFLNEHGIEQTLSLKGLPAIIVQHEIDHLDGKLIVDYLSMLKKEVVTKRLKKRKNA